MYEKRAFFIADCIRVFLYSCFLKNTIDFQNPKKTGSGIQRSEEGGFHQHISISVEYEDGKWKKLE